jgi:ADP-heptose:LPS heptosyltransferase
MIKRILMYNSGGGLGDSIQIIPLILSLKKYFKDSDLYYLGAHENHYHGRLKEYNIKINNLNLDLKYFGFRWWHIFFAKRRFNKMSIKKFDLVIDLQSKIRNSFILKQIPTVNFYSSTYDYRLCTVKKNYIFEDNIANQTINNLNKFLNVKINKENYNLNYLSQDLIDEAKRLLPNNNYIGFSLTQGNVYRKKSWKIEKFVNLARKIVVKKKVPVFFIEKNNTDLINKIKSEISTALFPELKSKISSPALVTALSTRLEKAISIDNGIMHMIALSKIPMIVLFGPTNSKKFAPDNINVDILDSKEIYKSNDINKIGVEEVLKLI